MLYLAGTMRKATLSYVYSVEKDHICRDWRLVRCQGYDGTSPRVPKTRGYPSADNRELARLAADSRVRPVLLRSSNSWQ